MSSLDATTNNAFSIPEMNFAKPDFASSFFEEMNRTIHSAEISYATNANVDASNVIETEVAIEATYNNRVGMPHNSQR